MNKLVILSLIVLLSGTIFAQSTKTKPEATEQSISGTYAKGNEVDKTTIYFEQVTGYLGYQTANDGKVNEVKFRPDLTQNEVVIGDDSQVTASKWGFPCDAAHSCTTDKTTCPDSNYLTVPYKCSYGKTNLYFNKDQKYSDFLNVSLVDVQFTQISNSAWPLANTALLGLGPKSKYINYVLNAYEMNNAQTYELNFFYDIIKKDDRYSAASDGVFDITMKNFGQNKDNLQDENQFVSTDNLFNDDWWNLPVNSLFTEKDNSKQEILTNPTKAIIVNSENAYFAVTAAQKTTLISQIDGLIGCKSPCQAKDVDLESDAMSNNFVQMVITIKDAKNLKLKIPVKDIIYKVKDVADLQYSISDIANLIKNKVVPGGTNMALGRQFLLNTYLVFQATKTSRTIKIGQLNDMGKITSTERLYLMLFGVLMVVIILITLVIKIVKNKRGSSEAEYRQMES